MISLTPSSSSRAVGTVVGLLCVLLGAGCGFFQDSTSPSSTRTETFSGTLSQHGNAVGTFTVSQTGTVSVTLASLSPSSTVAVGLGIGTPSGTNACTLTTSTSNAVAGSSAQISVTENPGSFCVEIYDVGNLTTAVTYTINVTHS